MTKNQQQHSRNLITSSRESCDDKHIATDTGCYYNIFCIQPYIQQNIIIMQRKGKKFNVYTNHSIKFCRCATCSRALAQEKHGEDPGRKVSAPRGLCKSSAFANYKNCYISKSRASDKRDQVKDRKAKYGTSYL